MASDGTRFIDLEKAVFVTEETGLLQTSFAYSKRSSSDLRRLCAKQKNGESPGRDPPVW